MEGKRLVVGDEQKFAYKVWNLKKLEKKYLDLIKEWENNGDRGEIFEKYLKILKEDPFLPRELLPKNWVGDRARKIILGK